MAGRTEVARRLGQRTGSHVSVSGKPAVRAGFCELPDDTAWERAHHFYTSRFKDKGYSDIQEQQPAPIEDLECTY